MRQDKEREEEDVMNEDKHPRMEGEANVRASERHTPVSKSFSMSFHVSIKFGCSSKGRALSVYHIRVPDIASVFALMTDERKGW